MKDVYPKWTIPRNKIFVFSAEILPKYRLPTGPETILPTDSQLTKKSEKNRRNIINSRYFGEISRLSQAHMCWNFWKISVNIGDISVNIGDISVKYRKYRRYIGYFDLNQIQWLKLNHNGFLIIQ